jgi:hypothetical protein
MSEILVKYICGHQDVHERLDTGPSDPSPFVCECEGCWGPEKDMSSFKEIIENPDLHKYYSYGLYCRKCYFRRRKEGLAR